MGNTLRRISIEGFRMYVDTFLFDECGHMIGHPFTLPLFVSGATFIYYGWRRHMAVSLAIGSFIMVIAIIMAFL